MEEITKKISGDRVIWVMVILLAAFSILAVYSSTGSLAYKKQNGNTEFYLLKHGGILLVGFILMYLTYRIPYHYFSKYASYALIFAIVLLMYAIIYASITGRSINNSYRFIMLPFLHVTFQPSDIAKVALIAYIARIMNQKQAVLSKFKEGFWHVLWPVGLICLLVLPGNFSTAALIFIVAFVIFIMGNAYWKHLVILLFSGLILAFSVITVGQEFPNLLPRATTWSNRVINFVKGDELQAEQRLNDPDYQQSEQAKIAIATGGLFGKAPGKSIQRNFLPSAFSDFIWAVIIEEYGLILGGFGLMFIYLIILYRGIRIALACPTIFGTLLAFGITFSIIVQAFVNMAVACGLIPVTGQTLPMISMGGTSIWFTCIMFGMLQSIAKGDKKIDNIQEQHSEENSKEIEDAEEIEENVEIGIEEAVV
ncbi:MAG: FtsW/RodA/SpoVE family cell cycle protein [Lentimicrobium sp.]